MAPAKKSTVVVKPNIKRMTRIFEALDTAIDRLIWCQCPDSYKTLTKGAIKELSKLRRDYGVFLYGENED